jgi:hypothetical protein
MKPNKKFNLSVDDIQTIETALFLLQKENVDTGAKKKVVELLAKLHHQKVWFRPRKDYVSG